MIGINWNAVVQGTTTGIVGAAFFWGLGIVREATRDLWLRRSIQKQLKFTSCGHGIHGVTTSIHNHLQKAFRVREVVLVTDRGNYAFNATGEVVSSGLPLPRKITRDIKQRLKKGEAVEISTSIAQRKLPVPGDHIGFVEVKPFTSQGFVLPLELMNDVAAVPKHLQITVEYETWTKLSAMLLAKRSSIRTERKKEMEFTEVMSWAITAAFLQRK